MQKNDQKLELLLEETLENAKIAGSEALVHYLNMALYEHKENMKINELKRLGIVQTPSEHQS
ncbi:MAG: hypothetical protein ABJN11_02340 [Lentilitoribacter sp.]|jgi:hypothetical protein